MSNTTHGRGARLWKRPLSVDPSAWVGPPNLRNVTVRDVPALGTLLFWAFLGTIDDAGETESQYALKAAAILGGRYGEWIRSASWVIEDEGDILSACLVCNYKPYGCPVIAVVATTPTRKRSGDGQMLVNAAALSLARLEVIECCAMITVGNNASERLFSSCGFLPKAH